MKPNTSKKLVLIAIICLASSFIHNQAIALEPEWISLAELTPENTKVGFHNFQSGKLAIEGKPIKVKKVAVRDGLYAHAPSEILYDISGKGFKSFKGKAGLEDNSWGEVRFKIIGDGKILWESEIVKKEKPQRDAKTVDFVVDVTIVSKLQLIVDDLGNSFSDHSVWINPALGK
jgi:hypothetical protein